MPQFTIRRLMLVIAGIGILLGLLQTYTYPTALTLYAASLASIGWLSSHGRPRVAEWGFALTTIGDTAALIVLFGLLPIFHQAMISLLAAMALLPISAGFGVACIMNRTGWTKKAGAAILVVLSLAIPTSILATRWPFYLAFYLSSPALNRLANRLDAGGKVAPGEWAGLFPIRGQMTRGGETILIVDPNRSNLSGFIRKAGASPGQRREWLEPEDTTGVRWVFLDED